MYSKKKIRAEFQKTTWKNVLRLKNNIRTGHEVESAQYMYNFKLRCLHLLLLALDV